MLLPEIDFAMDLSSHACTDTTKDHIRNHIDNAGECVVSFAIGKGRNAAEEAGKDKQTVAASDQANVVFVKTQTVGFSNDIGGSGHGGTRTKCGFQTSKTPL